MATRWVEKAHSTKGWSYPFRKNCGYYWNRRPRNWLFALRTLRARQGEEIPGHGRGWTGGMTSALCGRYASQAKAKKIARPFCQTRQRENR